MKILLLINILLSLTTNNLDNQNQFINIDSKISIVIGWDENENKWISYDSEQKKINYYTAEYKLYSEGNIIETFYDGKILTGIKDGKWIYWDENGIIDEEMNWSNGKLNGRARDFYKESATVLVEGYYKDGKADGNWSVYDIEGNLVKQELVKENIVISLINHKIVDEDLQRPKNIPKEAKYSKENKIWYYLDKTRKANNYTTWYINGELNGISTLTKDGLVDGKVTLWYKNGKKLSEGNCINGEDQGEWLLWLEDGSLAEKQIFNEGKMVSRVIIGAPKIPVNLLLDKVQWDFKKKMWFIYDQQTNETKWYYANGMLFNK